MASLKVSAMSNVHNTIADLSLYEASPPTSRARDIILSQSFLLESLLGNLKQRGIQAQETNGRDIPPQAVMHDRAAPIPAFVISPRSEWGVAQTLKLLKDFRLYDQISVSVKSGGHGYFNGASCSGVMVDLAGMTGRQVVGDTMFLEPGSTL